jgi:hypothetical protein
MDRLNVGDRVRLTQGTHRGCAGKIDSVKRPPPMKNNFKGNPRFKDLRPVQHMIQHYKVRLDITNKIVEVTSREIERI